MKYLEKFRAPIFSEETVQGGLVWPITTSKPKSETMDDEAITSNNLPKEEIFGSFPVLNTITPKAKAIQQAQTLPTILTQPQSNDIELDNRRNQINQNQNTFASSNSIVQPAFLKPTKFRFKQPSQIIIPETQRSIGQPQPNQPNRIQPQTNVPQTITVKMATTEPVFPF